MSSKPLSEEQALKVLSEAEAVESSPGLEDLIYFRMHQAKLGDVVVRAVDRLHNGLGMHIDMPNASVGACFHGEIAARILAVRTAQRG